MHHMHIEHLPPGLLNQDRGYWCNAVDLLLILARIPPPQSILTHRVGRFGEASAQTCVNLIVKILTEGAVTIPPSDDGWILQHLLGVDN